VFHVTANRHSVPVIGLVGGIGSGKSFLSKELANRYRVAIVEGDATGHQVLKEESVKNAIRARFGNDVFDRNGEVDRRRMSALVFGSAAPAREARAALEAIVHPYITERLTQQITAARNRPGIELVVLDAALLLEAGWSSLCDRVIFVDAPDGQRLSRVERSRGWSPAELKAREESQFSLERKRREADDVVDNSKTAEHALAQLEAILSRTTSPSKS